MAGRASASGPALGQVGGGDAGAAGAAGRRVHSAETGGLGGGGRRAPIFRACPARGAAPFTAARASAAAAALRAASGLGGRGSEARPASLLAALEEGFATPASFCCCIEGTLAFRGNDAVRMDYGSSAAEVVIVGAGAARAPAATDLFEVPGLAARFAIGFVGDVKASFDVVNPDGVLLHLE